MGRTRVALASILLAVSASLGSTPANAAVSDPSVIIDVADSDFDSMTPAEIYQAKTAVTHEELLKQLGVSEADSSPSRATAAGFWCTFASDGDYVHVTDNYASGHGWWLNVNCPSTYRADVTIWLEENLNGTWYLQGNAVTGFNRLPGSGSTVRVTNKLKCVNSSTHRWRSIIKADIVGQTDTNPLAYTLDHPLACY